MEPNPENRNKTRFAHESPITLENMDVGDLGTARMYNFSDFGLYFEADFLLQPETEIHIGITNSPFTLESDTYESFRGIIRWRKPLIKSSFYYGYGVELLENESSEIDRKTDLELRKHPRKTCSLPLKYETKSLLYQGIIENVSRGGIFIKTQNSVTVGQRIKVAVPLTKEGKIAKIIGIVAWSNPVGFGVKFRSSD
jgi:Tfp pilus assembly protein PilZ